MGLQSTSIAVGAIGAQIAAQAISANNIANSSTPGYRAREARTSSVEGGGARVSSTRARASLGSLVVTGDPLDLAIGGAGFFAFQGADGITLSRNGSLSIDAEGLLGDGSGRTLAPEVRVPAGTERVAINASGDVLAVQGRERTYAGTLRLATVTNPAGLEAAGETQLRATPASGDLLFGEAGRAGFGRVIQGALESSNVDLASEAVGSVLARRAFQANAAVIRTGDALVAATLDLVPSDAERANGSRDQLEISQAAGLRDRVQAAGGENAAESQSAARVRERLSANRLSIPEINGRLSGERRHLAERFNKQADGNDGRANVRGQELVLAQRQAAQLAGIAVSFDDVS